MIKLLRQGAIENPWIYRIIMAAVVLAFVITMGWWGFSEDGRQVVARVGDHEILFDDYQQAYRRFERTYRDALQDQFTPELAKQLDLQHLAVNSLIERQLWLETAENMGLTVTDQELASSIAAIPAFQDEGSGRFNRETYHQILAVNRLTPETFESSQRDDLLIEKVRTVVGDSIAPTTPEWEEARSRQEAQNPGPISDSMLPSPLPQKQDRALRSYMDHIRRSAELQIHEHLL